MINTAVSRVNPFNELSSLIKIEFPTILIDLNIQSSQYVKVAKLWVWTSITKNVPE